MWLNTTDNRFKAFVQGATRSVVTEDQTQTLTNKTLTAPVVNSPTGIVKADVGLGNVDNTSDATKNSAVATLTNKTLTSPVINSPTGLVKADVGLGNVDNTSDATKNAAAVTLTNKDYDGGTASNTSRLTVPKETKANLDTLTRKEATVVYSTDRQKLFFDNGTTLKEIGTGSGGSGINYITNPDAENDTSGWVDTSRVILGSVDGTTDTFTATTSITFIENEPLIVVGNVSGATTGTTYYAKSVSGNTTQLSATPGGAALNLSTSNPSTLMSPSATFRGEYVASTGSSWTSSTVTPLRGLRSFLLSKPASRTTGEVKRFDFTIDATDKGKVLQIGFDYTVSSGTYVTGDLVCLIRDVTNNRMIQPSAWQIESVGIGTSAQARMTFQTSSDSVSYEFIIFQITATALAYDLRFDNFVIGPQVVPLGAPVTDWVSYTPTGSWSTNTTYTGRWRRVGDSMQVSINLALSGAPTAADLSVDLPSGYVIDTAKIGDVNFGTTGYGTLLDGGTRQYVVSMSYRDTDSLYVIHTESGNAGFVNATNPITFANSDEIVLTATVPIVGWSSSTVVSSSADTRVVDLVAFNSGTQSVTANTTNIAATSSKDSVGGWNGTQYTIKVPGDYNFTIAGSDNVASTPVIDLYVNAVSYRRIAALHGGNYYTGSLLVPNLKAGDVVSFRSSITTTLGANFRLEGYMLQGPSQIAASEVIACRAYLSTNQTGVNPNASGVKVNFNATTLDTHGGWNTGTYRYTCPAPGIYEVDSTIYTSGTNVLANTYLIQIFKNGAGIQNGAPTTAIASTSTGAFGKYIGECVAGDYFEVYFYGAGNNSVSTLTLFGPTGTVNSNVTVKRLGGVM